MWKGIYLDTLGSAATTLSAKFCIFKDAEHAITAMKNSKVILSSNIFTDNLISVYTPDSNFYYASGNNNPPVIYIGGCVFSGSGNLKPDYYHPIPPPHGSRPFAAIDISRTPLSFTSASNNTFYHLSNGIIGRISRLTIRGSQFYDIYPDPAYDTLTNTIDTVKFNGSSIYGVGHGFDDAFIDVTGLGISSIASYTFSRCHYSIFADRVGWVNASLCKTTRINTGFRVAGVKLHTRIRFNNLQSYRNAIELYHCDGSDENLIENNIILFGSSVAGKHYYGIDIHEMNGLNKNAHINENIITFRPGATSAFTAVNLNSASNYFVTDNTITMFDNTKHHNGVFASGCNFPTVSCNTITGGGNAYDTSSTQSAIANEMCNTPTINCNVIDKTNNGIYIISVINNKAIIEGNEFNDHSVAFRYSPSAVTNELNKFGNKWNNQLPQNNGWLAWNENPNQIPNSPIYNHVGPGTNVYPNSLYQKPQDWFRPDTGVNFQCVIPSTYNYCSQFSTDCNGDCATEFDRLIAEDSIQNDPYTDETRWMLKKALFEKLANNPSLLSSSLMANFYNQTSNTLIAALQAIDLNQQSLFVIDTITAGGFNQNDSILQLLMDTLNSELILLQVAIDNSSDTVSINATIESIRQVLWMITSANDSLSKQIEDDRSTQVDSIKADNAALNPITNIESNEKQVNDIYLSTIAKGIYKFTAVQESTLVCIAKQCPMAGGNAVFRARALLTLINNTIYYDDKDLCNRVGLTLRKAATKPFEPSAKLYPNPTNESATLIYKIDSDCKAQFLLFNSLGQQVLNLNLNTDNEKLAFSTSQMLQGIYHYVILCNGTRIDNGKFVVIH